MKNELVSYLNFKTLTIIVQTGLLAYVLGLSDFVKPEIKKVLRSLYSVVVLCIVAAMCLYKGDTVTAILIMLCIYITFPKDNKAEGFNGHCNWASIFIPSEGSRTINFRRKRYVPPIPKTQIYRYDKKPVDFKIKLE